MPNEIIRIRNLEQALKATYQLFLSNGIDKTTKEMIAKESGLSRKSIDRYFSDKTDCVICVIKSMLADIRSAVNEKYPDEIFTNGKYTGAQLLKMYMNDIKKIFINEPRIFVLYTEFKIYIYRNCPDREQGYTLLWNLMGNRNLRQKIYRLGKSDGTLPQNIDLNVEEEYFCESFFGFLSNLALSFSEHSSKELEKQIDDRIANTLSLYTGKIKSTYS
jgi:AcrR family transcriptional regulator